MAGKNTTQAETQKWMLTHDSHELKKGDIYEGVSLPVWLEGKANPISLAEPEGVSRKELKDVTTERDGLAKRNEELQAEVEDLKAQLAAKAEQKLEVATPGAEESAAKKDK